MSLRVGFAGTPAFATFALRAIVEAGFNVPLVVSRPDRPRGRGLKLESSEVADLAVRLGLGVLKPETLSTAEARGGLLAYPLDVLVVAAYGLILPRDVLAWPRHGCLNIHASLLPRWRGAAPIQRAIEAGDNVSGITVMQMNAGLDTGPMIATREVAIQPRETAATLADKLALAGSTLIVEVLRRLERDGRLEATPQPDAGASYAAKIGPADARIDWGRDAASIDRQVRAYDPVPGAFAVSGAKSFKVWRAEVVSQSRQASPGTVTGADSDGIEVACGVGQLRLIELQPAGGRRMSAAACVAGRLIAVGSRFDIPMPPLDESGASGPSGTGPRRA